MTSVALLQRLGLFVMDGFVEPDYLAGLLTELDRAPERAAEVYHLETGYVVRETERRTTAQEVSEDSAQAMTARLMELKPRLEAHFGLELAGCQPPQFLHYRPGDFFGPHVDSNTDPAALDTPRRRKVSVVVFLNAQTDVAADGERTYSGGSLVFLVRPPAAGRPPLGVPFPGRPGMLVAFLSHVPHEVRPVTRGDRHSVVSWFF